MKPLAYCALAAIAAIAGWRLHPFGAAAVSSQTTILEGAAIDPAARHILERACANCHSEKTAWPWYGSVAPVSWMLERDIVTARRHMNLSHWNGYSSDQRLEMLSQIGAMTRGHLMPPAPYRLMHPEARLSEEEIAILYQWERTERSRLRGH